jgi:arsenate reductase
MAEAYLKLYHGKECNIFSAGVEKHGINPFAIGILMEDSLDISNHYSKTIEELDDISFDLLITVCDHANEVCPVLPPGNLSKIHHNFKDPSKMNGSSSEIIKAFRETRDEIKEFCRNINILS